EHCACSISLVRQMVGSWCVLFAGWSLRFDGARRMYSCDSCRRLLNQGCACAGNGRSTRHDYIFFCACLSEVWRVYSSESLLGGVPYLLSDNPQRSMANASNCTIRATYAGEMK